MRKTILMLTANPTDTTKLKLAEEIEKIEQALQRNQGDEQFELKAHLAVTPDEVRRALLDIKPHFVHFSGHGAAENGIILENEQGKKHALSTTTLAQVFEPYHNQIECVILNACFTAVQASAIVKHIDYVIGMNQPIKDKAAIQFAIGFYDTIAAGKSIETAFKMGCYTIAAQLSTQDEHLKPVLKKRYQHTICDLPIPPNPFFTGRDALLREIQETLHFQKAAALSGLGGVGKTQTAAHYAYQHQNEYQAVLWTLADTPESLKSGLVAIAHSLDLPEKDAQKQQDTIDAVKKWLQSHEDWLLIFDNADDISLIDPIFRSQQCHLLLTTRAQTTEPLAQRIGLSAFSEEEGTSFLRSRSLDKPRNPSGVITDYAFIDKITARQIAQRLDNLPLALDQAGAYIRETQCGLSGYLERYRTHAPKLLARRGSCSAHPDAIAKTWLLSFENIAQENPTARDILSLCAFLHPDNIAEEIFSFIDTLDLDEALSVIFKYSLVHRDPNTQMLSIHRLVQLILKQGMDETEQRDWAEKAVRALVSVFPYIEFENWALCERLLPCAQTGVALIEEWVLEFAEAASLRNQTGYYLKGKAEYAQAKPLYERALAIREKMLGKEHPSVATSLNNIAGLYYAQGAYEQALPLYERALAIWEKMLGKEHPSVANSLNNLALLHYAQGAYEQAKPLLERALKIANKFFKSDHPDVRLYSKNYALLLEEMEYSGSGD
ncbi:MAG: tetratricopeptide repeat protein [Candidatus Parabeggiatoa sp.]|nr:tetratricopeptide repeat protein [Candidatus Parabeggiatoa sp.]